MFHYSGRLAGLDDMVLKISAPSKVASAISRCAFDTEPYPKVKRIKKRRAQRVCRSPLTDKTLVNNAVPCALSRGQRKSVEKDLVVEKTREEEQKLVPPNEPGTAVRRSQHDIESFRHLPPLSSASTLQLPSFLNFSTTHSLTPHVSQSRTKSSRSLPASILFRLSSGDVSSSRRVVIRKTKNAKVYEGPHWIPTFHHPNSPYVPWSSPVRRRILRSMTPESGMSSPVCSRSGAVAPEPWGSHTSAETQTNMERCSISWKKLKKSVKSGFRSVKKIVSRIGKVPKLSLGRGDITGTGCDGESDRSAGDYMVFAENPSPTSVCAERDVTPCSQMSLGSLVSSNSATLAAWLAERHSTPESLMESPGMSLEEYEMRGSWLDFGRGDGEWVCGVEDCEVHNRDGSPDLLWRGLGALHTAKALEATINEPHNLGGPKKSALPVCTTSTVSGTAHAFCSLPLLVSRKKKDESGECMLKCKKSGELNMPGGWAFT